jgi:Na+/proline symporter
VLLFASLAVIVMLKVLPAVCGLLIVLKMNRARAPGLTVTLLVVPDLPPPLVEIEMPVPAWESVTWPVQIPATNAVVVVGVIVPEDAVKVLVPV